MEIRHENQSSHAIVHVKGEIDMHSSPEVRAILADLVKKRQPLIIVDLADVKYIDSSGVATMVECLQGVRKYNGSLRLASLRHTVKDVFALAHLDTVFDLRISVQDALD